MRRDNLKYDHEGGPVAQCNALVVFRHYAARL
jgi:hypothetical protein